jgi:deoxyadenosine/deoxycytidine kinase
MMTTITHMTAKTKQPRAMPRALGQWFKAAEAEEEEGQAAAAAARDCSAETLLFGVDVSDVVPGCGAESRWTDDLCSTGEFQQQHIDIDAQLAGVLVLVEGTVGAGKSTLLRALKSYSGARNGHVRVECSLEEGHEAVLAQFAEDPANNAQLMQVHMHSNAQLRTTLLGKLREYGTFVVVDRGERGNFVFASVQRTEGNFSDSAWKFFCTTVRVPWFDDADVVVFLYVPNQTARVRLRARGTVDEQAYTDEYLRKLDVHNYWMVLDNAMQTRPAPMLVVPWAGAYGNIQEGVLDAVADMNAGRLRPVRVRRGVPPVGAVVPLCLSFYEVIAISHIVTHCAPGTESTDDRIERDALLDAKSSVMRSQGRPAPNDNGAEIADARVDRNRIYSRAKAFMLEVNAANNNRVAVLIDLGGALAPDHNLVRPAIMTLLSVRAIDTIFINSAREPLHEPPRHPSDHSRWARGSRILVSDD